MRFLMLNWRDPKNPLAGGAERVTLAYLKALAERGHEVYWFANGSKIVKQRKRSMASASFAAAAWEAQCSKLCRGIANKNHSILS